MKTMYVDKDEAIMMKNTITKYHGVIVEVRELDTIVAIRFKMGLVNTIKMKNEMNFIEC